MRISGFVLLIYGLLILVGGVMGHARAASTASLAMGSLFGVLLITSGTGVLKDSLFSAYLGMILTLILAFFFAYRWLYTLRFLPAGLLCLISCSVLCALFFLIRKDLKSDKEKF